MAEQNGEIQTNRETNPKCGWGNVMISEMRKFVKDKNPDAIKQFKDFDIMPMGISYFNTDPREVKSHAYLLNLTLNQDLAKKKCPGSFGLMATDYGESRATIIILYDRSVLNYDSLSSSLIDSISNANSIIKGLGSDKLIPELK